MPGGHASGLVKPHKPWTRSEEVLARPDLVERAQALDALFVAPLAILPKAAGDPVRVFRVGIHEEFATRLKPGVALPLCVKALRAYVHSFAYRLAMAQPDSVRLGIDGRVVEPVSDGERQHAQEFCQAIMALAKLRRAGPKAPTSDGGEPVRTPIVI